MEFTEHSIDVILNSQIVDLNYLQKAREQIKKSLDFNEIYALLKISKDICVNNIEIIDNLLKTHESEIKANKYDAFIINKISFKSHLSDLLIKERCVIEQNLNLKKGVD